MKAIQDNVIDDKESRLGSKHGSGVEGERKEIETTSFVVCTGFLMHHLLLYSLQL